MSRLGRLAILLLLTRLAGAEESGADLEPIPKATHTIGDIDAFVTDVLLGNANVGVARLEVERTRGVARQMLAALLPDINAGASAQYALPSATGFSGMGTTGTTTGAGSTLAVSSSQFVATGTVSLSQSVIAPQAWYAIDTSARSVSSAAATAEDRVRTTLADAFDDLLAEMSAARAAEVGRVGLRSAREVAALTQRKLELGSATRIDVLRTQKDMESARATVISADEALRRAREALALVLGVSIDAGVDPRLRTEALDAALKRRCRVRSIELRPDVAAAALELDVARRAVVDSKLGYAPSIALSSSSSISSAQQLSGSNWSFNLAGSMSIPIWDGGVREGKLRSTRAILGEKQLNLAATSRAATVQRTQASRGVSVAESARACSERASALATEIAKLTRGAFTTGSGTSFDVVDAARKAREAELDLVGKDYDFARSRVDAFLSSASCGR